ncbi:MAG: type II toxin-antitoxin system YafQ family toxin [Lachnoclostridium sp.]|nr:type II toxin-antitoxin system YafQ family toxin [Lachnoclostridium sp.]
MNKYTIEVSNRFKKDFKLCIKRGLPIEKIQEAMHLLQETGSLPPEYKPHKLSGKYAGKWECHINGHNSDWLMVWEQNDNTLTLLFLRTGSHSDIF